jgi:D-glycero-D-manno-heptose 1,7-bisphosphate phosphatase
MTVGFPASGKSTSIKEYTKNGYVHLSRDNEGGKVIDLLPKLEKELDSNKNVVLDCTYLTIESRKPFIEVCKSRGIPINCLWVSTSTEDCQINALNRMWDRYGKIFFDTEDLKEVKKDPNMFPIGVIFKMKKEFEKPTVSEGFEKIIKVNFERKWDSSLNGKAIFLDYDGTLRECIGGNGKYPVKPSEVSVRPNVAKVLSEYRKKGYILVGVSNQSGIGKGHLTKEDAEACFKETNRQIGIDIEYCYCPHTIPPANCYCRKPQSGMAIRFIRKYNLDPTQCLMVGDMTTDETFANRLGMKFINADKFFLD